MQIDFHHAVTYVAARAAGFDRDAANIIAYSAQYVDDATNGGIIRFDNGALYHRISSAHKMLDYRNLDDLANHTVWIPFHFLPGNDGLPAGENPHGRFIKRLVCRPDSHVARDMLKAVVAARHRPYGLYRLGIAMHVYADTWAHQGFAGVNHEINEASVIRSEMPELDQGLFERLANYFVSDSFPLGHGSVLGYPDQPYLVWEYKNGFDERVTRDNPADFLAAADSMCRAMQCYRAEDEQMSLADVDGLSLHDAQQVERLLKTIKLKDAHERHRLWLRAIREGQFSFGAEEVGYVAKGAGSWKHRAIGTESEVDLKGETFPYDGDFLRSNWKYFHDALQSHRFEIIHDILPKYGICAA